MEESVVSFLESEAFYSVRTVGSVVDNIDIHYSLKIIYTSLTTFIKEGTLCGGKVRETNIQFNKSLTNNQGSFIL